MSKTAARRDRPAIPEPKTCAACGRSITWRKKWARDWDAVKYCSDACRQHKGASETDIALEAAILALLADRSAGATICPSEAARVVGGSDAKTWRSFMEPARAAARRLVGRGRVEITQAGKVIADPSRARGPIRIRLKRHG